MHIRADCMDGKAGGLARRLTLYCFICMCIASVPLQAAAGASSSEGWKAPSYKAKKANPVASSSDSIAKGKQVFQQQCVVCHGTSGKGDGPAGAVLKPPPASLVDPRVQDQSDGAIFWKLSTGRAPMPAFEAILSEENRWNIINFIRSLAAE